MASLAPAGILPAGSDELDPNDVPEGWELVKGFKRNGTPVQYYTNVLNQKFYTKADLMRNIADAKKRGLSIYAPDFNASDYLIAGRKIKRWTLPHGPTPQKKQNKVEDNTEIECASALLDLSAEKEKEAEGAAALVKISAQTPEITECRTSRRLAGLEPELCDDFTFSRALEYVIKDRPRL